MMIGKLKSLKESFLKLIGRIGTEGGTSIGRQDQRVDNFSRLIASPMPRRQMIKLLAAGLTAPLMVKLEPSVFASEQSPVTDDACCRINNMDTATQCCTPSGVQPKYPISDLNACPDRIPHPGHDPTSGRNGCGPANNAIIAALVPNGWGGANFVDCCNLHDDCYGTCNSNKTSCDTNLGICNSQPCQQYANVDPALYQSCLSVASGYGTAVFLGGGSAYSAGQSKACDCCSSPNSTPLCGSTCCGDGLYCSNDKCCPTGKTNCNNQCVDTKTDPNNCKSCGNVCAQGGSCVNSECTCPAGQVVCNNQCVSNQCPSGQTFNTSTCMCDCPGSQVCGSICCPSGIGCCPCLNTQEGCRDGKYCGDQPPGAFRGCATPADCAAATYICRSCQTISKPDLNSAHGCPESHPACFCV